MELPSWFKIENLIGNLDLSGWFKRENKKQINASINIGKISVNNFQFMDEVKKIPDKLIEGKGISVSDNVVFPFEKPTNFRGMSDQVVKRVSLYLAPVIYEATKNREVNIEAILNNTKAMFVSGRNYYDKDYWVQHCASLFREILVFIQPLHFKNAHKNIPDPQSPEIEKAFIFLINSVTYLSSVVHHRQSQLMDDAESLYPNQGYGQMSKTDFLKQGADFLEHLCIDVVYTLDAMFSKYCVNQRV